MSFDTLVVELFLSIFEANRYCYSHMSQLSILNVDRWMAHLINIRREDIEADLIGSDLSLVTVFVEERQDKVLRDKIEVVLQSRPQSSATIVPIQLRWSTDALATFLSPCCDGTPLDIVSGEDYTAHKKFLSHLMAEPLSKDDQEPGDVYLYEVEGNPGLVKIECNRTVKTLYIFSSHVPMSTNPPRSVRPPTP